jgi:hypothetical protein
MRGTNIAKHAMPKASKVVAYTRDAMLIFVPLGGLICFLFNPDAFNAFLAWMVGLF